MSLAEFRKQNRAKHERSVLWPHKAQIEQLLSDNYSLTQISLFLKKGGIEISTTAISKFIQKRINTKG